MAKSVLIYKGPSELNGEPIIGVVTNLNGDGSNPKTKGLASLWILPDVGNHNFLDSVKGGADSSVCGSCPKRRNLGGSCYVSLYQAPNAVYNAYLRGSYKYSTPYRTGKIVRMSSARGIRLGAYGDPAALPESVLTALIAQLLNKKKVLSYTHQWREEKFSYMKLFTMASCDTLQDVSFAERLGWRTFYSSPAIQTKKKKLVSNYLPSKPEKDLSKGSFVLCRSDEHIPEKMSRGCADCGLCGGWVGAGSNSDYPLHPYIELHGVLRFRSSNV